MLLKRAAVQWGIGRYLYDCPKFWVPLLDRGAQNVYGDFKIKGKKTRLSGYFNPPSLPAFALPAGGKNNQSQKNNQQPQKSKQPQQHSQNGNANQQQSEEAKRLHALNLVKDKVKYLEIPDNYLNGILGRIGNYQGKLEDAPFNTLNELYKVINPVNGYVKECRKHNLTDDELLDQAQITLCVELKGIHSLYFKMDSEKAKETLANIIHDRQIAS